MRRCEIAPTSCRHRDSTPCCKDCRETGCKVRCQNDPAKCHCCADKPPRQKIPNAKRLRIDREKIYSLYQQGASQRKIAERMGCCLATVNNALREMGVTRYGKS